ncbi:RraA family protein [Pseudoruegeria sp. HB172150]|uniref:RraA family protein n=1 Tax=Pseudoruegeria sp. HB172150 TaxID=2721164 RepID=UPI001555A16C|nr:RraA family protein [Pseudoruegeria sp. HB172150]
MIEEPPLLTIRRPNRRPTAEQIAAFQGVPTSFVVDAMYGAGAFPATIRALGDGRDYDCRAAGPALTVDTGPGDILALLAALPEIREGDVVVSSFGGYQGVAAAGDRVSAMMKNCGAAGFITDGPMRDYAGIVAVGLPAWCSGLTPGSPFGKGPGRVGFPVTVAGQPVETGDMIVADRDGVVVVPFARIDEVIAMLPHVTELENTLDAELQKGLKIPQDILDLVASDQVRYV